MSNIFLDFPFSYYITDIIYIFLDEMARASLISPVESTATLSSLDPFQLVGWGRNPVCLNSFVMSNSKD